MIELPNSWIGQPPLPVEADRSNPLARDLRLLWSGQSPTRDAIIGPATIVGSAAQVVGLEGFSPGFTGTQAYTWPRAVTGSSPDGATLFALASLSTRLEEMTIIGQSSSASATPLFRLESRVNGAAPSGFTLQVRNDSNVTAVAGVNSLPDADRPYFIVGVYRSSGNIELWVDGVLAATAATVSGITLDQTEVGYLKRITPSQFFKGNIWLAGIHGRALTPVEISALSANPWQLFRPIQRRIWVPVAGGVVSHATSGALANPGGATAGTATRTRALASSGVLANPGAQVVGAANRQAAAVSHATSGVLANPGATLSGTAQNGVSVIGKGFEFTSTPSALWWKRKPKALPEEVAEQQVQRVVRVIKEVAAKQQPEQTAKQAQRQVAQAVAPLLAEMPGFDWTPLYRNIVADFERQREEAARIEAVAQIARIRALEQDDEDILLLMI